MGEVCCFLYGLHAPWSHFQLLLGVTWLLHIFILHAMTRYLPLHLLETFLELHFSMLTIMLCTFCRCVEDLEIQISSCSVKDVMVLITVTVNILHTRWDMWHLPDCFFCTNFLEQSCCISIMSSIVANFILEDISIFLRTETFWKFLIKMVRATHLQSVNVICVELALQYSRPRLILINPDLILAHRDSKNWGENLPKILEHVTP